MKRAPRRVWPKVVGPVNEVYATILSWMYTHIYIYHRRERERKEGSIWRDEVKEIRGCKKRRQPPVTSRLHCATHAQLTIFREKNLPSKFCATAREARGSCSSRALDRGSRGGGVGARCRDHEGERPSGKRKRRKAREALLGVIVMYRFSKSFYPVLGPSFSFLFLLSATSLFPVVYLFRCLFVSFGTKTIVHAAVGV